VGQNLIRQCGTVALDQRPVFRIGQFCENTSGPGGAGRLPQRRNSLKTQAFVPLVTHPEANSDAFGAHATAAAAILGAGIHALAVNASIPKVSNALSRMLLDTPELIRQAETASRERGNQLLAVLKEQAAATGVDFTGEAMSAPLPLMTEVAADHARYYDLSLVGWEAGNSTAQATAEAVVFGSGRPTILLPELVDVSSFDHIAIAWDGSRVAARAVADAFRCSPWSTRSH
jgi:nucleotide-binding universal stress UspA family protein